MSTSDVHDVTVEVPWAPGATTVTVRLHLTPKDAPAPPPVPPEVVDEEARAQFLTACSKGNIDAVRRMLHHPSINAATLNAANNDGWTPLYAACYWNRVEVVKELLGSDCVSDAHVNAVDNRGWTPLYIACVRGHLAVMKALLGSDRVSDAHVRARVEPTSPRTAFARARFTTDFKMVQAFLDSGRVTAEDLM